MASRRGLTVETRVQIQFNLLAFVVNKVAMGQVILRKLLFSYRS